MNRPFLTFIAILTIISTLPISNTFAQEEPRTLIQTSHLRTIAFSPDSQTLASLENNKVLLWDVATGKHKFSLQKSNNQFYSLAFSPDGNTLATGLERDRGHGTLYLWDVATGKEIKQLNSNTDAIIVLFSPDGNTLASMHISSWNNDTTINLWDTQSGNIRTSILGGHINLAQSLSFSPDSSLFAHEVKENIWVIWRG